MKKEKNKNRPREISESEKRIAKIQGELWKRSQFLAYRQKCIQIYEIERQLRENSIIWKDQTYVNDFATRESLIFHAHSARNVIENIEKDFVLQNQNNVLSDEELFEIKKSLDGIKSNPMDYNPMYGGINDSKHKNLLPK